MRFALLTLFSILSCASAEVVECSYDGGCHGPGCRWTRLYNGRYPEGSRWERYIDVTEGPSCGRKGNCVSVCKIVGCSGPAEKCKITLKQMTCSIGHPDRLCQLFVLKILRQIYHQQPLIKASRGTWSTKLFA